MKKTVVFCLVVLLIYATIPTIAQAETDVSSKLVAEYNFNDSTTNDAVGTNHATLYDNTEKAEGTYVDGLYGKALKMSTKGELNKFWLSIPYEVFDKNPDSFTISIVYKATGYNTVGEDSELFSLYSSTIENFLYYSYAAVKFQNMGYSMKWKGLTKDYGYANIIHPYKKDQWVHLVYCVAAVDGRSVITAYADGKRVDVDQGGSWDNSLMSMLDIDTFTVGGKNTYKGGETPSCLFYGLIDDIQIYTGALTAEEAKNIKIAKDIKEPPTTSTTEITTATSTPETTESDVPDETSGSIPADTPPVQNDESGSFTGLWIAVVVLVVVAGVATVILLVLNRKRKVKAGNEENKND